MASEWNETCSQAPRNRLTADELKRGDGLRSELARLRAELAAEREAREQIESEKRHTMHLLGQEREQSAALAAVLDFIGDAACFDRKLSDMTSDERENICRIIDRDATAILTSDRASQRRKGAAGAVRRIIDQFTTENDRPWFEKMLAAIERGEVEVGE